MPWVYQGGSIPNSVVPAQVPISPPALGWQQTVEEFTPWVYQSDRTPELCSDSSAHWLKQSDRIPAQVNSNPKLKYHTKYPGNLPLCSYQLKAYHKFTKVVAHQRLQSDPPRKYPKVIAYRYNSIYLNYIQAPHQLTDPFLPSPPQQVIHLPDDHTGLPHQHTNPFLPSTPQQSDPPVRWPYRPAPPAHKSFFTKSTPTSDPPVRWPYRPAPPAHRSFFTKYTSNTPHLIQLPTAKHRSHTDRLD